MSPRFKDLKKTEARNFSSEEYDVKETRKGGEFEGYGGRGLRVGGPLGFPRGKTQTLVL